MAAIDRKGKDSAGVTGNGAGIVPWSLRNNGGSGEGITPSNGAAAGVTPNVKTYSADAGETFDINCKQQLATTAVYPAAYTSLGAPDPAGTLKDGSVNYADNAIKGGPKNNQYMGAPSGSDITSTGITQPTPIKGNDNQYSQLGE